MKSFFALVTPFDPSLKPDQGLPKPQPPTGGGGQPPRPDHTLPGDLPHPEHPIYYPLPPDILPPYIDNTLPGEQPHPDQGLPGPQPHPEHPIFLPPGGGGWLPVYIDNTLPGDLPKPTHPIVLPPDGPAPPEAPGKITWKAIWTPSNGWQVAGIIIPTEPIPTPSKKR